MSVGAPAVTKIWIVLAITALAAAAAWWDNETGIPTWLRLRSDLAEAERRIEATRARMRAQQAEIHELESDPLASERAIRRVLGLARPGEVVVHVPAPSAPGAETEAEAEDKAKAENEGAAPER